MEMQHFLKAMTTTSRSSNIQVDYVVKAAVIYV